MYWAAAPNTAASPSAPPPSPALQPAVSQQKLAAWECELQVVEAQLGGMGAALEGLRGAAIRRQAEREREVDEVRAALLLLVVLLAVLPVLLGAAAVPSLCDALRWGRGGAPPTGGCL